MRRGSYFGGSSQVRVGYSGTYWVRSVDDAEERPQIAKVHEPDPQSVATLERQYIFSIAYAKLQGQTKLPNPPRAIRPAVDTAGGFAAWCQVDQQRREWLKQAEARAQKKLGAVTGGQQRPVKANSASAARASRAPDLPRRPGYDPAGATKQAATRNARARRKAARGAAQNAKDAAEEKNVAVRSQNKKSKRRKILEIPPAKARSADDLKTWSMTRLAQKAKR